MLSVLYTLFTKCNVTPQEAHLTNPCKIVPIMHSFNTLLHYLYRTQHYLILFSICLLAYALSPITKTEVI